MPPRYDVRKQVGWDVTGGSEKYYRAFNIGLETSDTDVVDNGNFAGDFQSEPPYPGGSRAIATFSCEFEGGTAAAAVPAHHTLINACGFDISDSSGVALWDLGNLHTEVLAADIIVNIDGLASYIEKAMGNVVFTFEAGKFATMDFTFAGNVTSTYNGAVELALQSFTAQSTPAPCQAYTLTIGPNASPVGSLVCNKIVIDPGNVIDVRRDLNGGHGYSAAQIVGRNPIYTFTVEAGAIATLNVEDNYLDRGLYTFQFVHNAGGSTNQICTIGASGYMIGMPKKVVLDGKIMYEIQIKQASAAGLLQMQWS